MGDGSKESGVRYSELALNLIVTSYKWRHLELSPEEIDEFVDGVIKQVQKLHRIDWFAERSEYDLLLDAIREALQMETAAENIVQTIEARLEEFRLEGVWGKRLDAMSDVEKSALLAGTGWGMESASRVMLLQLLEKKSLGHDPRNN